MLPKQFKLDLRSDKDFFSVCKKKHSQYFSIFYRQNSQEGLKITVIVPKKTVKLAVNRNQVKRKFYLAIEKVIKKSKQIKEKNINLVFIVNKRGITESNDNLIKKIGGSLAEI